MKAKFKTKLNYSLKIVNTTTITTLTKTNVRIITIIVTIAITAALSTATMSTMSTIIIIVPKIRTSANMGIKIIPKTITKTSIRFRFQAYKAALYSSKTKNFNKMVDKC